jgi:hypothetical protein
MNFEVMSYKIRRHSCGFQHNYILTQCEKLCVISGFRRKVDEICSLLGYYAAYSSNSLSTFRDNLSVPSSRVKEYS